MKINLGKDSFIDFHTPSPVLVNEDLPLPEFDADGQASVSGLQLRRTVKKLEHGWSIKLAVTNKRKEAVRLQELIPLELQDNSKFSLDGSIITQSKIFRLARQKNDVPGPFSPAKADDAMRDAVFDSAEVTAGNGISWSDYDRPDIVLPHTFHSDPGFIVMQESIALFIGFCGQDRHLNDVELQTSPAPDRSRLDFLRASAKYDGIILNPGESRETHELILETGPDYRSLLQGHVDRIAKMYGSRRTAVNSVFCSWYFYGPDISAEDVDENLKSLSEKPLPFDVFQLDMGWQNLFGDWDTNYERFPDGMDDIAWKLRQAGYIPGIWTAPFVIQAEAAVLKRYPDLLLKDRSGAPCIFSCGLGTCYILDPFSPSAAQMLNEFYAKIRNWGFSYHKLDFLRAVFIHEDAVFCDPGKNRAEAYRHGMKLIRDAVGEDAIMDACGGLYESSAGYCDINRSGADVRGHWHGGDSRICGYNVRIKQNIVRNFYNRLWKTDPDALQLRRRSEFWKNNEKNHHLSMGKFNDEEAFSTVVNQFLGGGIACVSEKLADIHDDRRELYRHVMPLYAEPAQHFKDWDEYLPEYYVTPFTSLDNKLPPWCVVTLGNWNSNHEKTLSFSPQEVPYLLQAEQYAAYEFKTEKFLGIFTPGDTIAVNIPKAGCRLIRLTPLYGDGDYLIGTNMSFSCGLELSGIQEPINLKLPVHGFCSEQVTRLIIKNSEKTIIKSNIKEN